MTSHLPTKVKIFPPTVGRTGSANFPWWATSLVFRFLGSAHRDLLIFFAFLGLTTVGATAPKTALVWQHEDRVPFVTVTALVQTRDGYLWMGTYDGLVRFDGVQYTLFDSTRVKSWHDSTVTSLYEAPDGTLWIGHSRGAVSSYQRGVFTLFPLRSGGKANKIQSLASDEVGDVWALDSGGELTRVRDGLIIRPEVGTHAGVFAMAGSKAGRIWITTGGRLYELSGARAKLIPLLDGMKSYVQGVGASADGGVWVVANSRLWKRVSEQWSEELGQLSIEQSPISILHETKEHQLFAGTPDKGVLLITPGTPLQQQLFGPSTGLPSNWVLALCEDHEGSLWLGCGGAGLFKLRQKKVEMLIPPDGAQGWSVLTMSPAVDGGFWVGTEGAGLYHLLADGRWLVHGLAEGLRNIYIWSVYDQPGGALWVGNWTGLQMRSDSRFITAPGTQGLSVPITALLPAQAGGLWVGSHLGLAHYDQGVWRWIEPEAQRKLFHVGAIVEQPDGVLWASCSGDGLGEIRDGKVRQYHQSDGLSSDNVQGLYFDAADDALWIGTRGGGLNRYKNGRFAAISIEQGLGDQSISQIEDDGLGFLWMSSLSGILRVSKQELNDCAEGRLSQVNCLSYGLNDGVPARAYSSALPSPGCRMPDGRLVFTTVRGLVVIDPRAVRLNPKAPPVSIERLRVGEKVVAEDAFPAEPIQIEPGEHRIEIKYTGLSYLAPDKVRFKHRLEGIEPEWVADGNERHAIYNYLPPGHYVFQVTAANNDNVWNPTGASLAIEVLPYFWQTLWFKLFGIAALLSGTGGVVWISARRRLKRRLELLERESAIEAERTRIANDMHDDLGSHLTQITMLSETAQADLDDRPKLAEGLGRIYETARSVTRALDEIVWAVNPRHDTLESLINYCEKFAQDLLGAAGIRCRLDLPEEIPDWQPSSEVRHNLFLAYKEALNNAVRHSGASTVTVALTMSDTGCHLTVSDDGRGLRTTEPTVVPSTADGRLAAGNGIPSLRLRLARIGGTCEMHSEAGQGCTVKFFVPLNPPKKSRPRGPADQ